MENPHTPEKQTQPTATAQLPPTPPHSAIDGEDLRIIGYQQGRRRILPIRSRSSKKTITSKVPGAKGNHEQLATHKFEGKHQPDRTISSWLYDPVDPEQRRQRIASFMHSLLPSDDEFEVTRDPFNDSEEDSSDGDDDHHPCVGPAEKREVWQPKIGEEGIEDEYDLSMLKQAREEHKARAVNFERQKSQFIANKLREGIRLADIDMADFLLGPKIELDGYSSDSSYGDNEGADAAESKMEAPPALADSSPPGVSYTGPLEQEMGPTTPSRSMQMEKTTQRQAIDEARSEGKEHKKKKGTAQTRKPNKRRRGSQAMIDRTYQYEADLEDEQPTKKRHRNQKASQADADPQPWRAQTRAARRAQNPGS